MEIKKLLGGSLAMIAIITSAFALNDQKVQIYGHRGARGLAPENTIPAYITGLKIGIDTVDMDVGLSKDGVVVVNHNLALNPDTTRDSKGQWIPTDKPIYIKDLTWKEIETYDVGRIKPGTSYAKSFPDQVPVDGTRIPSLREVIRFAEKSTNKKINYQVEIKNDPRNPKATFSPEKIAKEVVKVLKSEGIDNRTELQAFDWRVLLYIQKLDKNIATAYLTDIVLWQKATANIWTAGLSADDYDNLLPKMISVLGGRVWGPNSNQITKEDVAIAHKYGLRVVPWTIDTEKEMRRMADAKVDAIITDRPDIARKVYMKMGLPVAEPIVFPTTGETSKTSY
jgi:glycerophosphoryl diester phosphodiesterase